MVRTLRGFAIASVVISLLTVCARGPEVTETEVNSHVERTTAIPVPDVHQPLVENVSVDASTLAAHFEVDSAKALSLCDRIAIKDVEQIFGVRFERVDNTEVRLLTAPVEGSCVFDFRKGDAEPANPRLMMAQSGIRVDVFSDAKLRGEEWWGTLDSNWQYRCRHHDYWKRLSERAWMCWTETEHAPDRAVLINGGEFMFEIGYYPPTSFKGTPDTDRLIERFAQRVLELLE